MPDDELSSIQANIDVAILMVRYLDNSANTE